MCVLSSFVMPSLVLDSCKYYHMWIRWQTRRRSGGTGSYRTVDLLLTATHWWVFLFLSLTSSSFSPQNMFQKCDFWLFVFFLEELCLELSRAIEAGDTQAASQHASALAGQKAALTIQLSEKNYADGEIKWEMKSVDVCTRLLCLIKAYVALSLLQFICCSGGCFLVSVRHRQSFSLHDGGCS